MITCDVGVLPVIREIQDTHPRVTWLWYSDDFGAGGSFSNVLARLQDLQGRGPQWGYFTEPTNIILVLAPRNVAKTEAFFRGMGLKLVTRSLYIGGFMVDQGAEETWR